ncbi:hypothetical protein FQN54_003913 [Arachnomyces sp. PD_36]|nr:hypothetical protein FQN54_003913 [Arachnomyces sp. PD_36]
MSLRNGLLPRDGVSLYYEVRGTGPLLFLISGAYGTSEPYVNMALSLSSHYTVVIFDRRGYYRSKKLDPEPWPRDTLFTENAKDTAALIQLLSKEPVLVFASSTGCLISMELIRHNPELIKRLVLHEPPPSERIDPDNYTRMLPPYRNIIDSNRESGTIATMPLFIPLVTTERERQSIRNTPAYQSLLALSTVTHEFFFEYELDAIICYKAPIEVLQRHRRKIALLNSVDSQQPSTKVPIFGLSEELGLPVAQTEGGHVGYFSHPVEFGGVVRQAFERLLAGTDTNDQMVKARL